MRIAVLVKPVPDPTTWSELHLDENKTVIRQGARFIINPLDKHALELALQFKDKYGGLVIAFSMAPPDAKDCLMGVLALGVDEAYLLTDPAFKGSDTLATARVLSAALQKEGLFDLIVCGAESADGSTAQVGPQTAVLMGSPFASFVDEADIQEQRLVVTADYGSYRQKMTLELPTLISVTRKINRPRTATLMGIMAASGKSLRCLTAEDLPDLDLSGIGLNGSTTKMGKFRQSPKRTRQMLAGSTAEKAQELIDILRSAGKGMQ
ncbi:MAG: electron transfer flavoprotein subunit beta/FixA family protein [Acidobacteriota bacterium]